MNLGGIVTLLATTMALGSCAVPLKGCRDAVDVYFSPGWDQINLAALDTIMLAATTLQACPAAQATLTGHVEGDEATTPALGLTRAMNVASVLAKNGVDRTRLTVRNAGRAPPSPKAARPSNRLVDIRWH